MNGVVNDLKLSINLQHFAKNAGVYKGSGGAGGNMTDEFMHGFDVGVAAACKLMEMAGYAHTASEIFEKLSRKQAEPDPSDSDLRSRQK